MGEDRQVALTCLNSICPVCNIPFGGVNRDGCILRMNCKHAVHYLCLSENERCVICDRACSTLVEESAGNAILALLTATPRTAMVTPPTALKSTCKIAKKFEDGATLSSLRRACVVNSVTDLWNMGFSLEVALEFPSKADLADLVNYTGVSAKALRELFSIEFKHMVQAGLSIEQLTLLGYKVKGG
jgi:hypothetical protein